MGHPVDPKIGSARGLLKAGLGRPLTAGERMLRNPNLNNFVDSPGFRGETIRAFPAIPHGCGCARQWVQRCG